MLKILIIEDEEETRDIISTILHDEGFECLEAENGSLGIDLACRHLPDLIICDIQMPKMNGFEVLEKLTSNPDTDHIPFIFLTGNTSHEDIRKGMKIGADDYLLKPFKVDDLIDAVKTRIKKKENIEKKYQMAIEQTKNDFAKSVVTDALTGLPNRIAYPEEFKKQVPQNNGLGIGVIMIGIDRLRNVNEAFGIRGGDHVIKGIKDRLEQVLTNGELLFRGESDFFLILVPKLKEQAEMKFLVKKTLQTMRQLFRFENHEIHVTISLGGGFSPPGCTDPQVGLSQAGMAVHAVRYNGGNGYQFYDPEMKKFALDHLTLESALVKSLERRELMVYFQPQVNIATNSITGMEALMRWKHPEFGLISPAQFIPMAEANGLIVPIGEWILYAACRQAKVWRDLGYKNLKLAVNISGRQLETQNLVHIVDRTLDETEFPPQNLELEITESLLMKNPQLTTLQLSQLKERGIAIAIDDFGTGYSSLTYLRQFPIDTLKLDHSFVKNIPGNPSDLEIASAVIKMAHSLKLTVVAEGIETPEQLESFKSLNCDDWQGFLLSPPVPSEKFQEILGQKLKI